MRHRVTELQTVASSSAAKYQHVALKVIVSLRAGKASEF